MRIFAVLVVALLLGTCSPHLTLLEQVQREGMLTVVTRNAPTSYYIGPEGPVGPEYELARGFADFLGVRLHVSVRDQPGELLDEVQRGRAQLAAAGLIVTPSRQEVLAFGPPYNEVTHQLVYRLDTRKPRSLEQTYGRRLEVVANSSFVDTLETLRREAPGLTWVENPASDLQNLLARVSTGEIDFTVADSAAVRINRYFHPDIRVAFDVSEPQPVAWAFRGGDDSSLLDAAYAYFSGVFASGRLDEIKDRYFGHTERFDYVGTRTFLRHIETRLPRYREWFEDAAADHAIDWRLLAALSYQESHWNPQAISPTGVRGMMMLTQRTAEAMGVTDREDAEQSIRGGAQYLKRVLGKIPERIPEPDRTWMALAAYNVGFGHLEDARRITQGQGGDPDRWADVREHLPLLAQESWYRQTRFGYARGWEPVRFVDNIRRYYEVMAWITADSYDPAIIAASD